VFRVVLIVLAGLMGGLTWFGGDCRRVSSGLVWLEEYLDHDDERSIDVVFDRSHRVLRLRSTTTGCSIPHKFHPSNNKYTISPRVAEQGERTGKQIRKTSVARARAREFLIVLPGALVGSRRI